MASYTGDNVTISVNPTTLFAGGNNPDGVQLSALYVKCVSGGPANVRVPALHGTTGYASIATGESAIFRVGHGELTGVVCLTTSAVLTWYGVANTKS